MKYLQQFAIICIVSFVGELLNYFLPFPIPGNIYGMIVMFILLMSGCIKLHQVKSTSKFLLDIMPILFIPSAVGIMTKSKELRTIWWQIIIITIVTTMIVMVVSGKVTQIIVQYNEQKRNDVIHKIEKKSISERE